jgi:hypothetical protein
VQAILLNGAAWSEFFGRLPRAGNRLLEHLEQDEPFKVRFDETNQIIHHLDRLFTRLSLSVLSAALILGLAILIPSVASNNLIYWIAIIGFVVSVGLGLWLFISMARSRK